MTEEHTNYNLLDEGWIPVLWADGHVSRVGIKAALLQAGRIRQIAASNPMDRVAIIRFLLAVLYWCRGNPPEDVSTMPPDGFPPDWLARLDENRDCFNLLGEGKRFYQDSSVAGLKRSAVTNLLHDLPSGSNKAHFRHVRDFRDGLCLACCALALLRWPCFASAGTAGAGQSMTASINGNTPTFFVPTGSSLLGTLLAAWPSGENLEGDVPVWQGGTEESPLGFLKGLTWQSRRILLAPLDSSGKRTLFSGICCYCGEEKEGLVKSIVFRPGWKRPSKEPWGEDPHLLQITRLKAPRNKAKQRSVVPSWASPNDPLEEHANVWRSVLQGLWGCYLRRQLGPREFQTTLVGSSQQLYTHAATHITALPQIPSDVVLRILDELEWLGQVTWMTASARGRSWREPPKGHRVVTALREPKAKAHAIRAALCALAPLCEGELEKTFQNLARDLAKAADPGDQQTVSQDWEEEVERILRNNVRQAVRIATAGSPLRRREAAGGGDYAARGAVQQIDRSASKGGAKK